MKKQYKLRTKLLVFFTSATLIIAILFIGASTTFLQSIFDQYEKSSVDITQHNTYLITDTIASTLIKNNGELDFLTEKQLLWFATLYNVEMTLYDINNEVIHTIKTEVEAEKQKGFFSLPQTKNPDPKFFTAPLQTDNKIIGSIIFRYYGDSLVSDSSLKLRISNGIVRLGILSSIVSVLLILYIAYRVSKPLKYVIATAMELSHGNLNSRTSVISTTLEITELCTAIDYLGISLEKQETLRKRLTADVSHELRTPLNILRNQIEAMQDGIFKPDKKRLGILLREVERLTHMVSDLEKLTNLDEDTNILKPVTIELASLISDVINQMETDIHNKHLHITKDLDNIHISCDYNRLKQVLINILSNAIKFSTPDSIVDITLKTNEHSALLQVKDYGIGIPAKDLPYVFERFYRAENSRNRKTGGAGLGLAIVKEIIEAHQGTISISNNKEKGITVLMEIPLKDLS